jgi:hypothetical protein
VSFIDPHLTFGEPARPFSRSFWGTRLPDAAKLDANSSAIVGDLAVQARLAAPTLNITSWTAEPLIVPADQPLVPVTYSGPDGILQAVMALGLPIPAGWQPTADSDGSYPDWEFCAWQPSYVSPYGPPPPADPYVGRYYESYHTWDSETGGWQCGGGGRMNNVNLTTRAHFNSSQTGAHDKTYATDPDSTYCNPAWGVQGSGLPLMPGILSKQDCDRGYVDHALLLEVVNARAGQVWPAQRNDGNVHTAGQNGYVIYEGQRLRFPIGYQPPSGLHPLAKLIVQAGVDYGFVIADRAGCLGFRGAPSAASYLAGVAGWQAMIGFPWSDLQAIAVGNDTIQTPTS